MCVIAKEYCQRCVWEKNRRPFRERGGGDERETKKQKQNFQKIKRKTNTRERERTDKGRKEGLPSIPNHSCFPTKSKKRTPKQETKPLCFLTPPSPSFNSLILNLLSELGGFLSLWSFSGGSWSFSSFGWLAFGFLHIRSP